MASGGQSMASALGFVKLVSPDGHEFIADEKVLKQCDVLKRMIENENFVEGQEKVCPYMISDCLPCGR